MTDSCRFWLLACIASSGLVHAQIRTDGSVGPAAQNLLGPSYQIQQTLGKLAGSNLFHSFQTFNIGSGQSATFSTSTPGISNVISRVTGGQMSQINGALTLSASSGSPAFYFINPAGVTFGAGASVDVPGAFHVGTANSVKFADGRFNADLNQGSTFSSAPPEAFGFLGNSRASIFIHDGAVVRPKPGFPVSVVAGDVGIYDRGTLGARTGEIRVTAVGDAVTDVPFSGPLRGQAAKVNGNLLLSTRGTILSVNGDDVPPGAVNIDAGDVTLSDFGNIRSLNAGAGNAADIRIQAGTAAIDFEGYVYSSVSEGGSGKGANIAVTIAQGLSLSKDASISTDTFANGQAGHVRVQAGHVQINSAAYVASTVYDGTGGSGNVEVTARDLIAVSDVKSRISATTTSSGAAGTVLLVASDIALSKDATVYSFSTDKTAGVGGVTLTASKSIVMSERATVLSNVFGSGDAGDVRLSADNISLDGNSFIAAGAQTADAIGKSGSVVISARGSLEIKDNSFLISGTNSDGDSGSIIIRAHDIRLNNGRIASDAFGGIGNAGLIDILATGLVALTNNAAIGANSGSLGNAGSVNITSAALSVASGSLIASNAFPSAGGGVTGGNAGNIRINAVGTVSLNQGTVSTNTSSSGQGGRVDVNAGAILLEGSESYISAAALTESTGRAGNVTLRASDIISLSGKAFVATDNFSTVIPTGSLQSSGISLSAPTVSLRDGSVLSTEATGAMSAGNIDVSANRLELAGGTISTEAQRGNGGSISVRGGLVRLAQSQITTSVLGGFGNGGDIRIDADALVLRTGFIQANTDAQSASGGLIKLNVNTRVASGNTLFVGGQDPRKFNPDLFGFNVIQAAAPTGISGAIEFTSPELDLTGSLGRVNAQVLDGVALGRDPCQTNAASSVAVVGRGGLPVSNRALLGAPSTSSSVVPATTALPQPGFNSPPQHIQLARASIGCTR